MEINTQHLLCQILCKKLLRFAVGRTVVAVVMVKLILNIYCARLYVNTCTLSCWENCCIGGYVEINTLNLLSQIVC